MTTMLLFTPNGEVVRGTGYVLQCLLLAQKVLGHRDIDGMFLHHKPTHVHVQHPHGSFTLSPGTSGVMGTNTKVLMPMLLSVPGVLSDLGSRVFCKHPGNTNKLTYQLVCRGKIGPQTLQSS